MSKTFLRRFTQLVKDLRTLGVITPGDKIRILFKNGRWYIYSEFKSHMNFVVFSSAIDEEFHGAFDHWYEDKNNKWRKFNGNKRRKRKHKNY